MKSRSIVIAGRALALLFARAGLLFGARALYAQVDAGSILGTVTDASGAVISGATVTLTNEGTAASLSTTTGSDGLYKFSPVKIGPYKIDVVLQGFQAMTAKGVVVNIGANVVQDLRSGPAAFPKPLRSQQQPSGISECCGWSVVDSAVSMTFP